MRILPPICWRSPENIASEAYHTRRDAGIAGISVFAASSTTLSITGDETKLHYTAPCNTFSVDIQYTILLVSNTSTVVLWPCSVLGYTGSLVIK